jgi:peroxiredoxin
MGKAARTKAARRATPPPPVGKNRPRDQRQLWIGGGIAAAAIAAIVIVVVVLSGGSTSSAKSAAPPSASDRNASKSLISAADKVGFKPTTEAGTGTIENQPISAAGPPANQNLLAVGAKAPNFTLKTPQGQNVSLSQYRGKTVLVEFFATWCPHCNAEQPHLNKIYASLPKSKYQFVGVNADGEDAPSVFAFHRYYGTKYPALLDPSSQPGSFHQPGAAGKVSTEYQVQYFPTMYIVGPDGVIQWRSDGEQPDALLKQELKSTAAK